MHTAQLLPIYQKQQSVFFPEKVPRGSLARAVAKIPGLVSRKFRQLRWLDFVLDVNFKICLQPWAVGVRVYDINTT
jgi:hypothetical protein